MRGDALTVLVDTASEVNKAESGKKARPVGANPRPEQVPGRIRRREPGVIPQPGHEPGGDHSLLTLPS